MKKNKFAIIILIFISLNVLSQSTLITPGNGGNIQVPNLTYSQIIAITNPKKGMVAYDISFNCLRFFNGIEWICSFQNSGVNPFSSDAFPYGNTANNDYGQDIVTDSNGNIYVVVNYNQPNLYRAGSIYLLKYDSNLNLLWSRTISSAVGYRLCLDSSGNIYLVGNFENTANFSGNTITSAGGKDMFLAKYNNNGVIQWVRRDGTSASELAEGLSVDANGNIYVVGNWSGSEISTSGTTFLMKYNSNGVQQYNWSNIATGYFGAVKAYPNNNGDIYLIGNFTTSNYVNIGGIIVYPSHTYNTFIAKLNSSGNSYWVRQSNHHIFDMTTDSNQNMYIVGDFHGSTVFNGTTYNTTGGTAFYVTKLDSDGNTNWFKYFEGTARYEGRSARGVAVDNSGNVYVSGYFGGGANTTINFGTSTLTNQSYFDGYIAKLSPSGDPLLIKQFNNISPLTYTLRTAVSTNSNIYVVGSFTNTPIFDNTTLNSIGGYDAFIAVFRPFK